MAFPLSESTFGWTAVPRSQPALYKSTSKANSKPFSPHEVKLPSSPVAVQTHEYAKANLPEKTFNHSMRVFLYGIGVLAQHLSNYPAPNSLIETYFLACLLHDIGTTSNNMDHTRLSFELQGAVLALDLLRKFGAPDDQAELVAEIVNRHQDLGDTGSVPLLLGLTLTTTIFVVDNVGENADLVHPDTIKAVTTAYPRNKWSGCFAETVRKEISKKPWSHSTVIENFAETVEGNKLMEPYD
ncbi:putative urea hydro-lyase/cyanamide hydratase [Eremomyces bilateralis CBS 781.70]|uniref:Urea hydro-lyase/cyanamide hydratase n=1 Tax=Eremomyces bilateralis CBS 781.70 TaxID=1392243 RepID=A0A6G1GG20_9PEZI|nr:putative urea hydro-lyase/cyanamide hydratase [Eremomyces bilateralis CBS 781.70]KAF1817055.1 putative urea hydro-lyase/cyanamide hydratase [Eremomyces bilateralis CBS 781.70]